MKFQPMQMSRHLDHHVAPADAPMFHERRGDGGLRRDWGRFGTSMWSLAWTGVYGTQGSSVWPSLERWHRQREKCWFWNRAPQQGRACHHVTVKV